MDLTPKVSIIIPVYNTELYLKQCLDSVFSQTYTNFEVICINDGSTDSSKAILDDYFSAHQDMINFYQCNSGLSSARNTGLSAAKGDLIMFLDSDDYLESTALERIVSIYNKTQADLISYGMNVFAEDDKIFQNIGTIKEYVTQKFNGYCTLDFEHCLKTNIHVINKVFKRSIIDTYNLRFEEGLLYEDISFMWFYFFVSKSCYYLTENLYNYRIRQNSIMESTSKKKYLCTAIDHLKNWEALVLNLKEKAIDVFNKRQIELFELLQKYTRNTKRMCTKDYESIIDSYNKYYASWFNSIKKTIDISIIVPVYNVEKYIIDCLASIEAQTMSKDKFEVLFVDDESTDSSKDIIQQWMSSHKEIHCKYLTQAHGGLSKARNLGLSHAKGSYIMFLDSDDYLVETALDTLYLTIKDSQADMLVFNIKPIKDSGICQKLEDLTDFMKCKFSGLHIMSFDKMRKTAWCATNKLYKRDLLEDISFTEELFYEDISFSWKIYLKEPITFWLNQDLYFYRLRQGSIMESKDKHLLHYLYNVISIIDFIFMKEDNTFIKHFHILEFILRKYFDLAYSLCQTKKEQNSLSSMQSCIRKQLIDRLVFKVDKL